MIEAIGYLLGAVLMLGCIIVIMFRWRTCEYTDEQFEKMIEEALKREDDKNT